MVTDATPPTPQFAVHSDQLERCAAIGTGKRPGHLQDARSSPHGLHAQGAWPWGGRRGCDGVGGGDELVPHHLPESGLVLGPEATVVGVERRGGLELHGLSFASS